MFGESKVMSESLSKSSEEIYARGKLFELVHEEQPDGRVFEKARRAPGVRLIIEDDQKRILLTKEYRKELEAWDYRLPGGKVFDSLDDYEAHRQTGQAIVEAAMQKAVAEGREEAGVTITALELFKKSTLGATVEWDLYVFAVTDWQPAADGQALEEGERIEADQWFSYEEVKEMVLSGQMQEERIALILLQWVEKQKGEIA